MEVTTDESSLANDILRGAKAIADFIGETEKRTRYLAERAVIPVGKEGGIPSPRRGDFGNATNDSPEDRRKQHNNIRRIPI